MTVELDSSSEGAYNDLFQFTLTEPMRTEIVLQCTPCAPHLTVTDAAGGKLEGDAGTRGGRSRIRRDLERAPTTSGRAPTTAGMSASTR